MIPGELKRERPKTRWQSACQLNMKIIGLAAGEEMDRATWSMKTTPPTLYDWENRREEGEGWVTPV